MNYKIVERRTENTPVKSIILYCTSHNIEEKTDKVEEYIKSGANSTALVVFSADDWDRDFSPWQARMPGDPDRHFTGKGKQTLEWLMQKVIPETAEQLQISKEDVSWYICGYSLAGLFALWAFYETGFFRGVGACSATLWFDGWKEYMEQYKRKQEPAHTDTEEAGADMKFPKTDIAPEEPGNSVSCGDFSEKKKVYLSLGGKEPRTSNPVMATIGTCYERQKRWMKEDPEIGRLLFEWNPGGHFADSQGRLLKGIRWLTS